MLPPKTQRGETAKKLLKLDWNYPTYEERVEQSGRSVASRVRKALPREDALKYIAGDDPRPLLLLRECLVCNGTDKALLSEGVDNERTFLLARWFRCVKLPADVLQADHPFRSLFDGKDPEHLFLSAADGSGKIPLESERSRTELWTHMTNVLEQHYASDMKRELDQALKLLDGLDDLDQRAQSCKFDISRALEKDGPDSKKIVKAKAKLEQIENERVALLDIVDKATKLPLIPRKSARPAVPATGV